MAVAAPNTVRVRLDNRFDHCCGDPKVRPEPLLVHKIDLEDVFARRSRKGEPQVTRNLSAEGGFAQWARGRLLRTLGQLAQPAVRQQSRDLARLSRWLDDSAG